MKVVTASTIHPGYKLFSQLINCSVRRACKPFSLF